MTLNKFGFLFTGADLDPQIDKAIIRRGDFTAIIIGMSSPEGSESIAKELVDDGIELIELCGGFGPEWTAKIIQAIDGRIPVGSVAYGPESIAGIARLFPKD